MRSFFLFAMQLLSVNGIENVATMTSIGLSSSPSLPAVSPNSNGPTLNSLPYDLINMIVKKSSTSRYNRIDTETLARVIQSDSKLCNALLSLHGSSGAWFKSSMPETIVNVLRSNDSNASNTLSTIFNFSHLINWERMSGQSNDSVNDEKGFIMNRIGLEIILSKVSKPHSNPSWNPQPSIIWSPVPKKNALILSNFLLNHSNQILLNKSLLNDWFLLIVYQAQHNILASFLSVQTFTKSLKQETLATSLSHTIAIQRDVQSTSCILKIVDPQNARVYDDSLNTTDKVKNLLDMISIFYASSNPKLKHSLAETSLNFALDANNLELASQIIRNGGVDTSAYIRTYAEYVKYHERIRTLLDVEGVENAWSRQKLRPPPLIQNVVQRIKMGFRK
jgi:hypothetical protein